jgi:hypothetical protein
VAKLLPHLGASGVVNVVACCRVDMNINLLGSYCGFCRRRAVPVSSFGGAEAAGREFMKGSLRETPGKRRDRRSRMSSADLVRRRSEATSRADYPASAVCSRSQSATRVRPLNYRKDAAAQWVHQFSSPKLLINLRPLPLRQMRLSCPQFSVLHRCPSWVRIVGR